jgi:hypothetical protein
MFEHAVVPKLKSNSLAARDYFHTEEGDDRWNMLFTNGAVAFLSVKAGNYDTTDYTTRTDR